MTWFPLVARIGALLAVLLGLSFGAGTLWGKHTAAADCTIKQTKAALKIEKTTRKNNDAIDAKTPRNGDIDAMYRFVREHSVSRYGGDGKLPDQH